MSRNVFSLRFSMRLEEENFFFWSELHIFTAMCDKWNKKLTYLVKIVKNINFRKTEKRDI